MKDEYFTQLCACAALDTRPVMSKKPCRNGVNMKIMIASDIHGSAFFCRRLIEAFKYEAADRMLLLGDLLYHGPRNDLPKEYDPKAVIRMLNEMKHVSFCVRGNCDTEVDQMVLDFPIMAEYSLIPLGNHMIFATHGHHWNKDSIPPLKGGDILLYGHTHIPQKEQQNGVWCLNPGSVSIPKNGSENGYMMLDGTSFLWKSLEGIEYDSFEAVL